jgi:hypothetical protein
MLFSLPSRKDSFLQHEESSLDPRRAAKFLDRDGSPGALPRRQMPQSGSSGVGCAGGATGAASTGAGCAPSVGGAALAGAGRRTRGGTGRGATAGARRGGAGSMRTRGEGAMTAGGDAAGDVAAITVVPAMSPPGAGALAGLAVVVGRTVPAPAAVASGGSSAPGGGASTVVACGVAIGDASMKYSKTSPPNAAPMAK